MQESIDRLEAELTSHGIQRAQRPLKYATVEAYVSHISAAHQAAEAHNPGHDNPMKLAMKTVRRISDGGQAQRAPIRNAHIEAIKALEVTTLRDRQDVLITLTAREVGARIGAVLDIAVQDLKRQPGGHYQVNLWRGKTDQDNEGTIKTLSKDLTQRIDGWLVITGIEQGPLFRPLPGKANTWAKGLPDKALSTTSGREAIRRCLLKVGITNVSDFGGHSTRIGGAMDVREKTGSDQDVMEYGNWKSPLMPMRYTEQLARERNPIHDVDNEQPASSELPATPEDYFIASVELGGPSWAEDADYEQVRSDIETYILMKYGAVPIHDSFDYRIPVPKSIGAAYFKALIDAIHNEIHQWLDGEVFWAECCYWTATRRGEWSFNLNEFDMAR